jgi:LytS/YehU family sensor histidine kinase
VEFRQLLLAARSRRRRRTRNRLARHARFCREAGDRMALAHEALCLNEHREMLRLQLEPHFLFNALASISGSLPPDAPKAREMIDGLAEFCRIGLLHTKNREWLTLAEELALLRAFLAVEAMRWGDSLVIEIECPEELGEEPIPSLLLLPLVENALKYGRATSTDQVGLRMVARADEAGLHIEVANTGRWVEPAEERMVPSLGVGLANVRARLASYYPLGHSIECRSADGWVTVALSIFARPALRQTA